MEPSPPSLPPPTGAPAKPGLSGVFGGGDGIGDGDGDGDGERRGVADRTAVIHKPNVYRRWRAGRASLQTTGRLTTNAAGSAKNQVRDEPSAGLISLGGAELDTSYSARDNARNRRFAPQLNRGHPKPHPHKNSKWDMGYRHQARYVGRSGGLAICFIGCANAV